MYTISEQSVAMGIPAIQLEIPRSIRRMIATSQKKIDAIASAILDLYWD